MILINIDDLDLRHNTHEIVLEMIEATEVSFTEIIIFGDSFGKVTLTNCDDLIFNKNTFSVVYENGNRFVVNHRDIAAFKVIK